MTTAPVKVEFYYDVISPYTYIAWLSLKQYRALWGLDVVLRPFFLLAITQETKNELPALNPTKLRYCDRDIRRASEIMGISIIGQPTNYLTGYSTQMLKVQRLIAAAPSQEVMEKLTDEAFNAVMVDKTWRTEDDSLEINDGFLGEICKKAGLERSVADQLIKDSKTIGKAALRTTTKEALE
ncbi:Glutathione S-transferase kappa 1, partial [Perkinsus olseni]